MSMRRDMGAHGNGIAHGSQYRDTANSRSNRQQTQGEYRLGMAIYALGDAVPTIHPTAFVHPEAVIIGSVTIGAESTIWPGAVLRGDDGRIVVGERTSIQDNTVIHTTPHTPTIVGNDCVIGHIVHLECCTIDDSAQVSSGAVVLHRAHVGSGAIVAANAVVLNDTVVPPGALAVGTPAVIKEGRARSEEIELGSAVYVKKGRYFSTAMRRLPDHPNGQ
jgi:carbonic anhydrase/acetyltransferase-like protein (isoleucine patch superfamily)